MTEEQNNNEELKEINFCPTCNSMVETTIIHTYNSENNMDESLHGNITEVLLSKCLNCQNPLLKKRYFQIFGGEYYLQNELQLFPNTENKAIKNCPEIVIKPYKEALKCYRTHAYDACVIMCRKGIEAICIDKGEIKGALAKRLENLHSKEILEHTFYKWANELRIIGNDGAHSHDQIVEQQDAEEVIEFFDALITYIYHLVNQYDELIERRKK